VSPLIAHRAHRRSLTPASASSPPSPFWDCCCSTPQFQFCICFSVSTRLFTSCAQSHLFFVFC
jgi:hypothetical protein